ncbi:MAG TPA: outer membrane lipoprotein-sorting protein [Armatimonadota bacterium]|nr:outer membrane lipoprotein-sorting protein [Armatimonadota bacterium]
MLLFSAAVWLPRPLPALAAEHPIEEVFAPGLKDLTLTAKRKQINLRELNKISRDYANAYRVGDSRIYLKEPGRFRLDAKAGPFKFSYIIVGTRKVTRAPFVNEVREIGVDPGKRQGPLEVGIVTPSLLPGYTVEFVESGKEDERPVYRYRLRYSHDLERYDLITVDSERHCLVKRQLYTQMHGKLKMSFAFANPKKVGAVWIPTRIEVRNAEGKLAGVTEQSDIVVNSNLNDDLFQI